MINNKNQINSNNYSPFNLNEVNKNDSNKFQCQNHENQIQNNEKKMKCNPPKSFRPQTMNWTQQHQENNLNQQYMNEGNQNLIFPQQYSSPNKQINNSGIKRKCSGKNCNNEFQSQDQRTTLCDECNQSFNVTRNSVSKDILLNKTQKMRQSFYLPNQNPNSFNNTFHSPQYQKIRTDISQEKTKNDKISSNWFQSVNNLPQQQAQKIQNNNAKSPVQNCGNSCERISGFNTRIGSQEKYQLQNQFNHCKQIQFEHNSGPKLSNMNHITNFPQPQHQQQSPIQSNRSSFSVAQQSHQQANNQLNQTQGRLNLYSQFTQQKPKESSSLSNRQYQLNNSFTNQHIQQSQFLVNSPLKNQSFYLENKERQERIQQQQQNQGMLANNDNKFNQFQQQSAQIQSPAFFHQQQTFQSGNIQNNEKGIFNQVQQNYGNSTANQIQFNQPQQYPFQQQANNQVENFSYQQQQVQQSPFSHSQQPQQKVNYQNDKISGKLDTRQQYNQQSQATSFIPSYSPYQKKNIQNNKDEQRMIQLQSNPSSTTQLISPQLNSALTQAQQSFQQGYNNNQNNFNQQSKEKINQIDLVFASTAQQFNQQQNNLVNNPTTPPYSHQPANNQINDRQGRFFQGQVNFQQQQVNQSPFQNQISEQFEDVTFGQSFENKQQENLTEQAVTFLPFQHVTYLNGAFGKMNQIQYVPRASNAQQFSQQQSNKIAAQNSQSQENNQINARQGRLNQGQQSFSSQATNQLPNSNQEIPKQISYPSTTTNQIQNNYSNVNQNLRQKKRRMESPSVTVCSKCLSVQPENTKYPLNWKCNCGIIHNCS